MERLFSGGLLPAGTEGHYNVLSGTEGYYSRCINTCIPAGTGADSHIHRLDGGPAWGQWLCRLGPVVVLCGASGCHVGAIGCPALGQWLSCVGPAVILHGASGCPVWGQWLSHLGPLVALHWASGCPTFCPIDGPRA